MNANTESSAANPANGKRRRILAADCADLHRHWRAVGGLLGVGAVEARENRRCLRQRQPGGDFGAGFRHGHRRSCRRHPAGQGRARCWSSSIPPMRKTALSRAANALAQTVRQVRQQKATADQYDSEIETRKLELARAEADLAKREPLGSRIKAIAGEEVRHAEEACAWRAPRSDPGAAPVSCPRMRWSTALRWKTIRRCCRPRMHTATRGSPRSAMRSLRRSPDMSPSAACSWDSTSRPGEALMTVIPLHSLWVDANFKEVQLRNSAHRPEGRGAQRSLRRLVHFSRPRAGHVGRAPARRFRCCRRKMRRATGSRSCSACRCESRSTTSDLDESPLRVGLSATVTVDTTSRDGPVLATQASDSRWATPQVYTQDLAKANADADAVVRRNLGVDR